MSRERGLAWGIAALVVAAPLCIGGVHPSVQVALSAVTFVLTAVYALYLRRERGLRFVPLALPAALAVGLTFAQLLPLPSPLVRALSPLAYELRAETGAGRFMPLTLDVPAT